MSGVTAEQTVDEIASRRCFNALIAPHVPALRGRASQLCRSNFDSDDIVQEALLRAYRGQSQLKDLTRTRAWLLTILTRVFLDFVRARRKRPDHIQLVIDDVPEPVPEERSPWDAIGPDDLRAAIDALSDDVRDTYRMFALEGHDYAQISTVQRIPIATVGTRMFRARKQLRTLLITAMREGASQ